MPVLWMGVDAGGCARWSAVVVINTHSHAPRFILLFMPLNGRVRMAWADDGCGCVFFVQKIIIKVAQEFHNINNNNQTTSLYLLYSHTSYVDKATEKNIYRYTRLHMYIIINILWIIYWTKKSSALMQKKKFWQYTPSI